MTKKRKVAFWCAMKHTPRIIGGALLALGVAALIGYNPSIEGSIYLLLVGAILAPTGGTIVALQSWGDNNLSIEGNYKGCVPFQSKELLMFGGFTFTLAFLVGILSLQGLLIVAGLTALLLAPVGAIAAVMLFVNIAVARGRC